MALKLLFHPARQSQVGSCCVWAVPRTSLNFWRPTKDPYSRSQDHIQTLANCKTPNKQQSTALLHCFYPALYLLSRCAAPRTPPAPSAKLGTFTPSPALAKKKEEMQAKTNPESNTGDF